MRDLSGSPDPVARYLRHVLPEAQPLIRRFYQRQQGELRTSARSTRWLGFQAEQVTNPLSVSYVWNARVQVLPLIHLTGRDSCAGGSASSHGRLFSRIPVTAQATLSDAGQSVSLEFRFNTTGEISAVYTPGRWEKFSGGYRQTPWEGHFHSYGWKGDMLVPSEAEVGWYHAGSWQKVWSGRILESSYELMQ